MATILLFRQELNFHWQIWPEYDWILKVHDLLFHCTIECSMVNIGEGNVYVTCIKGFVPHIQSYLTILPFSYSNYIPSLFHSYSNHYSHMFHPYSNYIPPSYMQGELYITSMCVSFERNHNNVLSNAYNKPALNLL